MCWAVVRVTGLGGLRVPDAVTAEVTWGHAASRFRSQPVDADADADADASFHRPLRAMCFAFSLVEPSFKTAPGTCQRVWRRREAVAGARGKCTWAGVLQA